MTRLYAIFWEGQGNYASALQIIEANDRREAKYIAKAHQPNPAVQIEKTKLIKLIGKSRIVVEHDYCE